MPRAPALRSSNFSSLQMQRYIYAERAVNISLTPPPPPVYFIPSFSLAPSETMKKRGLHDLRFRGCSRSPGRAPVCCIVIRTICVFDGVLPFVWVK
ncbi:hypothetical protein QQF64_005697 [Cirrhinus molitorella]|uniref:Uncharacterized protein n=1 Tax=Cirrhinus molitorella TaxID=172907 RepID=A0ABR3MD02_9TELE